MKKQCIYCKKYFSPKNLHQKYCNKTCRYNQLKQKWNKWRLENIIQEKERHQKYYLKHKKHILKVAKKWLKKQGKKRLQKKRKLRHINLKKFRPWLLHLKHAKERCNNPNHTVYDRYGGKGIKCLLTKEQIKILWIKYKADKMQFPRLHRKNSAKHYTLENCIFIENIKHIQLHANQWRKRDK
jgi:hypothetical protein